MKIKFTQRLVYDLVERVYLSQRQNFVRISNDPRTITRRMKHDGRLYSMPSVRSITGLVEVYDGATGVKLLQFNRNDSRSTVQSLEKMRPWERRKRFFVSFSVIPINLL